MQVADENNINPLRIGFKKYDASSYKNNFKSSYGETTYVVRYYETEPYKGLPAVVPFDLNNGWYAATKQTLPIGGNIQAYDASGAVNSFWLCNVGANGIEEFKTTGDDMCEMINKGTGQPYNQFAGLSEDEAKKRINAGEKAIEQASKQYGSGVTGVKIDVGYGVLNLNVGSPAVDIPDMQCQDFMSPKDCQLLFNVCDPVICPSSRCDFGGAYPVKDVIQSGIIGSIALCLPNIKEGIIIPVCLTGVQAGIDGLVSISTSYRDCLQESLETGKMVGVCDEIYSIYMCEFLWRQALPLAQIAIPKMMEWLLGQNVRGGGEYLGVESSLGNAEKSINYFTQFYGESSSKAFKARTTEEVGGEVCKVYASGIYPAGGNLLDSLTEPDSPPQFHGRFDEIPFTTATVPATSHYKVFYHIYSGKDSGAYYKVYLKGATETSFYQDVSSSRIVASGYIAVGGYASETKDFTAPSGYKEMCIMVNNQEECGFKQISTDFAINYVTDKYLEEQTTKTQIKTESECISGSASVYSLLNPNVQEGAGDVINPEIYNNGIIRVCATDNPGKGTDAYEGGESSRWVEVGYCDDEKIKCWIDTQSVKEVIKNTDIEGDALEEVSENQLDILRNKEGYISSDDFENLKKEIKGLIEDKKYNEAIDKVDESFDFVFLNDEKANLLLLRGDAYSNLATDGKISEDREDKTFVSSETSKDKSTTGETDKENIVKGTEEENGEITEEGTENIDERELTLAEKIYNIAVESEGSREYDFSADFVSTSLKNIGLDIKPNLDIMFLMDQLNNNEYFVEIDGSELEKGDIVVIGKGCLLEGIGIFGGYSTEIVTEKSKGVGLYTTESPRNPKSQGSTGLFGYMIGDKLENDDNYIYRAYRAVEGLDYMQRTGLGLKRKRWTVKDAIIEVNNLLKDKPEIKGGTYSENREFVNELIIDDVLYVEECQDFVKGDTFIFWKTGEKNMEDLKKILQQHILVDSSSGGAY